MGPTDACNRGEALSEFRTGTAGYPLCRFAYRLHKNPLPLAPPDTDQKTPTTQSAQQSQLILETTPAAKWLGQGPLTIGDAGARESSIQMFQQGMSTTLATSRLEPLALGSLAHHRLDLLSTKCPQPPKFSLTSSMSLSTNPSILDRLL